MQKKAIKKIICRFFFSFFFYLWPKEKEGRGEGREGRAERGVKRREGKEEQRKVREREREKRHTNLLGISSFSFYGAGMHSSFDRPALVRQIS